MALVGMRKTGWRDNQPAGARLHLATLIIELGFAALGHIIQIELKQQGAVQGIAAGILRIDLRVPMMITMCLTSGRDLESIIEL